MTRTSARAGSGSRLISAPAAANQWRKFSSAGACARSNASAWARNSSSGSAASGPSRARMRARAPRAERISAKKS
jgi:hypothetical protein